MKYLLLAKSNIRKTKGLTVGLILLITLAACFLNVFLLINVDFNKNAQNAAKKLNTEDVYFLVTGELDGLDEDYIKSVDNGSIRDMEITKEVSLMTELSYADGTVVANVCIGNEDLFDNRIGKFEILELDGEIKENYIYLPYQFYTGGGYHLGDAFRFKILNNSYEFKIKGFINTITFGSNNVGAYQLIVDGESYNKIQKDADGSVDSVLIKCILNDGVDVNQYMNKISNEILSVYPDNNIVSGTKESAILGRTFLGVILGAILIIVCAVVLIIVVLMMSNNISNFIRENMRTLGALKALGYTSRDIIMSFMTQFALIDLIGSVLGVVLSKYMMQLIGDIMVMQSAIPYKAEFIFTTIIITVAALFLIVMLSLLLSLRKAKKIQPIVALRNGNMDKNAQKTVMPLERSTASLNMNLSFKTTFTNKRQNIITAVISFFLIIMSSLSLVLYYNFAVEPKYSLLTLEMCDGVVMVDSDDDLEVYHYLENMEGVENPRLIAFVNINVDDAQLVTYIFDDTNKLQNKDAVYEGVIPQKTDEIVIGGKFAESYGYAIGDQIILKSGKIKEPFKITGFMQTMNNSGMEAMLLKEGAEKVVGTVYDKPYYFEVNDTVKLENVFDSLSERFGSKIKSTIDFNELYKGAMGTFQTLSLAIVVFVSVTNLLIILLVLYMLIKTLVNKKKKDYGILKAVGFTSKQIVFQNAISFIPSIALSVVISSVVSCFVINKIIGVVINMFGIMKLTFDMPVLYIAVFGVMFIAASFLLSVLLSGKIKKIEPYKLLIGE